MIHVDISNIWGEVSLPDLLSLEKEIFDAHKTLTEDSRWQALSVNAEELSRIQTAAERIRADAEMFVVVGHTASRAALELLQGEYRNLHTGTGNPKIIFTGDSFSTRQFQQLQQLLDRKDFSIAIIEGSLESAITARSLRWMLERKYGFDEARYRTCIMARPEGALWQLAQEEGWECFPHGTGNVLTAATLLPLAVAGVDIWQVLQGAAAAKEEFDLRSFENPVWLYAAVRNLMHRRGKAMELLCSDEPDFSAFGKWWQQLFASCGEGGLLPVSAQFPRDLPLIRQSQGSFFETLIRFAPPTLPHTILSDVRDAENLNDLADKTLDFVQEQSFLAALDAHTDSGISAVTVECGRPDEKTIGELLHFFELSHGISSIATGVNPLNPADETLYQSRLFQLLGRSE